MYSELYFWILSGDCRNCCFLKKNIFEIILYLFIFYPKTSNFHNSGMVSRRKLPNLALNNIFSFPIGLQYTLSFKWPDSDPKCRITIISKGQSLTLISLGEGGPGGGVGGGAKWPPGKLFNVKKPPGWLWLKFTASVLYEIFPFLKQEGTVIHFLNLQI